MQQARHVRLLLCCLQTSVWQLPLAAVSALAGNPPYPTWCFTSTYKTVWAFLAACTCRTQPAPRAATTTAGQAAAVASVVRDLLLACIVHAIKAHQRVISSTAVEAQQGMRTTSATAADLAQDAPATSAVTCLLKVKLHATLQGWQAPWWVTQGATNCTTVGSEAGVSGQEIALKLSM